MKLPEGENECFSGPAGYAVKVGSTDNKRSWLKGTQHTHNIIVVIFLRNADFGFKDGKVISKQNEISSLTAPKSFGLIRVIHFF